MAVTLRRTQSDSDTTTGTTIHDKTICSKLQPTCESIGEPGAPGAPSVFACPTCGTRGDAGSSPPTGLPTPVSPTDPNGSRTPPSTLSLVSVDVSKCACTNPTSVPCFIGTIQFSPTATTGPTTSVLPVAPSSPITAVDSTDSKISTNVSVATTVIPSLNAHVISSKKKASEVDTRGAAKQAHRAER